MDHFNTLVTACRNWNRHCQFVCFLGFFKKVFLFFEFVCSDMLKNTTEEYLVCLWKSRLTGANALLILQQKKTFYFIAIKALDKKMKTAKYMCKQKTYHMVFNSILCHTGENLKSYPSIQFYG